MASEQWLRNFPDYNEPQKPLKREKSWDLDVKLLTLTALSANFLFKSKWPRQSGLLMLLFMGSLSGGQNLLLAAHPTTNTKPNNSHQGVNQSTVQAKPPVMLGIYTKGFSGDQRVIDSELHQVDDWAGKRSSLAGIFVDIEDNNPAYNIEQRLNLLRKNGYTAFINLKSSRTAAEIAKGNLDNRLRKVAQAYAAWSAKGDGRMAFIAPMQEMNIAGENYSLDPENFKLAYQRIQQIFAEAGVARSAVRWVFAPNGWSQQGHEFEKYYPGSDRVDVVSFSAYNWGYCSNASWKEWAVNPADSFAPYINRMAKMAPSKPIFIAQTGSTSSAQSGSSSTAKDKWFRDVYTYLAAAPGVQAILYFNLDKECDWALYRNNGTKSDGYKDAIANPAFGYVSPDDIARRGL